MEGNIVEKVIEVGSYHNVFFDERANLDVKNMVFHDVLRIFKFSLKLIAG